jgi:hypothetical protein
LGATPAEAVSCVSMRIAARNHSAKAEAEASPDRDTVTSS